MSTLRASRLPEVKYLGGPEHHVHVQGFAVAGGEVPDNRGGIGIVVRRPSKFFLLLPHLDVVLDSSLRHPLYSLYSSHVSMLSNPSKTVVER